MSKTAKQVLKELGMGQKQQKNIRLLAEFLNNLPMNYAQFNMGYYHSEVKVEDGHSFSGREIKPIELKLVKDPTTLHICGTAGCAIGHAPMVLGVTKPKKDERWTDYAYRFLFDLEDSYVASGYQDKVWEWCFSGIWSDTDNTPQGAAKRMLFLLENPSYVVDEWGMGDFSKNIVDMYSDRT